ncbi:GNAT family N-acetyltransferase [Clostridium sp.]|uniref:GNAT family N-acetyltransferase n=1 Tax=Clostridium sp. TaxID=1506 RepID=UPI0032175A09
MNKIYFKDIDSSNKEIVRKIKLKTGQENFIETVDECLEEAKCDDRWHPVCIYIKDTIIGFAMYGCFGANRNAWIDRIMIDEKYQSLGHGKRAMLRLMEIVPKEYEVSTIYTSVFEDNKLAYELYIDLGFIATDERDIGGEIILLYKVK